MTIAAGTRLGAYERHKTLVILIWFHFTVNTCGPKTAAGAVAPCLLKITIRKYPTLYCADSKLIGNTGTRPWR
jgi:hypothetical protein